MTFRARSVVLSALAVCFALTLGATPALAKTTHHRHHHVSHTKHRAAKGSEVIKIAQRHLSNLGYYAGKIDGVMGSGTRSAIKQFQREHGLKADGALGSKTRRALDKADQPRIQGFATHDAVTASDMATNAVNPDYQTSLNGGTREIASRFARLDVSESGTGAGKRYDVHLNGQAVLIADGQPSVIGMSQTYDLGNEDAVIFTTFSPSDTGCIYRNHVLVMDSANSKMLDIENCTRGYDARVTNRSLYITFPETDDARAVGAMWRVEGERLERL